MSEQVVVPNLRLGKKAAKFDRRTLRLATYIEKRKLPHVPLTHNLSSKTLKAIPHLGKMKNDKLGDCTCAALGHAFQTWSVYGGKPWTPTDAEIVEAYNLINGGVDQGAAMLDALQMARNVGIGGNTIYAYVAVDPLNHDQVRTAAFLFGGLYFGANLPVSAQDQLDKGQWEVTDGPAATPGSWGGHAINLVDYDKKGVTFVTWGALQKATWDWVARYCDECYAVLEEDWVGSDNRSPQGFSLSKLARDIKALT